MRELDRSAAWRCQLHALRALALDRFANFFCRAVTALDRGTEDAECGVCVQAQAVDEFEFLANRLRELLCLDLTEDCIELSYGTFSRSTARVPAYALRPPMRKNVLRSAAALPAVRLGVLSGLLALAHCRAPCARWFAAVDRAPNEKSSLPTLRNAARVRRSSHFCRRSAATLLRAARRSIG